MRYVWDEAKRQSNLHKHGLDFADAVKVFEGETLLFEDKRFSYGEQRMICYGLLDWLVVVIVHAEADGTFRIISMRKATRNESNIYFRHYRG
jgi:uncharacterized DUF497 family protein